MPFQNKILSLCIAVVIAFTAFGCGAKSPRKGNDLLTIRSPDQNFEAVLREVDIDASIMVSQPYEVLIRNLAIDPAEFRVILSADRTDGLKIRWTESGLLEVCYSSARIYGFTNAFVALRREPALLQKAEIMLRRTKSLADCPPTT